MTQAKESVLQVTDLKKWFPIYGGILSRVVGHVKAVDGVSFNIDKKETFGLVGESGCGKTTMGRLALRLLDATEGKVLFEGQDIFKYTGSEMQKLRRNIQIIFQDPYASLNPRMRVRKIVGLPLELHNICKGAELERRVGDLLEVVGLRREYAERYPHEFSGGQRQRIGIARALALNPKLIVCDEPVSALDVSIRAQILNLLLELQKEFDLTYLFISHDLSVIQYICDRVGVMYLGKLVEVAGKEALYEKPVHPYTQALLSAIPVIKQDPDRKKITLEGDVPSPINPPSGCYFHPRCWMAEEICKVEAPPLAVLDGDHYVSCHVQQRNFKAKEVTPEEVVGLETGSSEDRTA